MGESKPTEDDWRLQGQECYLTGVTLQRLRWSQSRPGWDHDHCEFCGGKFGDDNLPDAMHDGWTTEDEYYWICDKCFADFCERFQWKTM